MAFHHSPAVRLCFTGMMCLLVTLPLSACQEGGGDALALAIAPETHGALLLTQVLPNVPLLLSEIGVDPEESAAVEAWWESWSMEDGEGERVRANIYPSAARRLFPALGREGVENLLARNQDNLRAVEVAGVLVASGAVNEALAEARRLQDDALAADRAGDPVQALALALRSVDAQWSVSPPRVAATLLDDATEALRRIDGSDAYSEEQLVRIRRLTGGAQEALDAGDYARAIRRAYYACQLLGVGPP